MVQTPPRRANSPPSTNGSDFFMMPPEVRRRRRHCSRIRAVRDPRSRGARSFPFYAARPRADLSARSQRPSPLTGSGGCHRQSATALEHAVLSRRECKHLSYGFATSCRDGQLERARLSAQLVCGCHVVTGPLFGERRGDRRTTIHLARVIQSDQRGYVAREPLAQNDPVPFDPDRIISSLHVVTYSGLTSSPSATASVTAWSTSMIVRCSSTVSGSTEDRSEPRRSQPDSFALSSHAPDRSTPRTVAPSSRTPVRSASRIRTFSKVALRRSAPGSPTNDQSPPDTLRMPNLHRSNLLPVSLHLVKVASK